ncbi:flagellar export chaperone FlgN [Vibrio hangzhouensis]|uniref:flagellar export chaperone FlgN n=1 Tax=Vibrio hangzhouensis TaxID=462991 RepID=UPI001C98327C|nr:flagellar export chaperone FlgN [Vibrio hangzhouensis]MBY6199136.1 flagellar protein FlgN [Vibrio hangzhouensis]
MAATRTELVQQFVLSITEDIRLYRKLLALLQHQKALYLKFDGEALSNNIHGQLPILKQLSHNASKRSQALLQLQLPSSELGVKKLIRALPAKLADNISKQWQMLASLIKECQKYNHDNGQSSAAFHELLGELTGKERHSYEEHIG